MHSILDTRIKHLPYSVPTKCAMLYFQAYANNAMLYTFLESNDRMHPCQ